MKKFIILLFIPFVSIFGSTKSAEQGNARAQYLLGLSYAEGKGVLQDYKQALYWFTKSAEQGNASAQVLLGLMYRKGRGVLQDYKQAVYWYKESAEQGNVTAQYLLGLSYDHGRGVPQDYIEAYAWINIAGANGKDVTKDKRLLSKQMTTDQIAKAKARSKVICAEIEAKKK